MARQRSLKVDVPSADQDKFRLGRVGLIAAFGFAVGMLWPRFAGVKLVPRPPEEADHAATSASSAAAPTPPPAVPPPAVPAPVRDSGADRVRVGDGQVTSCVRENGERSKDCGASPIDAIAKPRLLALSSCAAARDAVGVLSVGIELNFEQKKFDFRAGKSTTVGDDEAGPLLECVREQFRSAEWSSVQATQRSLTVYYPVQLLPAARASSTANSDATSGVTTASGMATVSWNSALVRGEPNKDGEVVARILSGTRVAVTGRQGDWYRVKYDAKGREGWVWRAAIGM